MLRSALFDSTFRLNSAIHGSLSHRIRPTGRNSARDGIMSDSLSADVLASLAKVARTGSLTSPFAAVGKSGVKHTFTFGAKEGNFTKVVCDMVSGPVPIDETKVLSLFIKVYDVGATTALLCATPALSPDAKKLADIYNMTVIEAVDKDSAVKKVADALGRINKRT